MMNKKEIKLKIFTLYLAALPLLALSADSSAIRTYEKKITSHTLRADSLKGLITDGEKTIAQLKQKEHSSLKQLNDIEQNIELIQTLVAELTLRADTVYNDMNNAQNIADSIGVELAKQQAIMEERLRQIYKSGKTALPAILMGSTSPTEALHRIRFAQDLNRYDQKILADILEDQRRRNTEIAILSIQNVHYQELLERKNKENEQLSLQVEERYDLLTSIRNEKQVWTATVAELKNSQKLLNNIVKSLIYKRDAASEKLNKKQSIAFEKRKGKMLWPIHGDIITPFGKQVHPVHGTVITNKGIAIAGAAGEPVRAVAPGVVEHIGRLPGYGKVLIINHYEGYLTIYAHLGVTSSVKGEEVAAGKTVGTVGETGSLSGSKLHFEIRKGAETRNPLHWLRKREI